MPAFNIFFKYGIGCKISFIDFDDAKYGPSVCDVAIAISNLFFSKKSKEAKVKSIIKHRKKKN